jgi:hypothetical protein
MIVAEQENQMIELCAEHMFAKDQRGKQRMPFEHWPLGGKWFRPNYIQGKGNNTIIRPAQHNEGGIRCESRAEGAELGA